MKRFIAMTLVLILTVMLIFTGCNNSNSNSSTSNGQKEKVVRTNVASEPDSLNPWKSAASDTESIFLNVFEGLVAFNENGDIIPSLAKEWTISDDNLTYTFNLRNNVFFHNNQKFTSADVLYSYKTLMGIDNSQPLTGKLNNVAQIKAPDDFTFIITLKSPSAMFLGFNTLAILPQNYTDQDAKPVGTGPFKFASYTPGQKIVLTKNDKYYNSDKMPKIDVAEIYIMSDLSAVLSAIQSGQLDIASVTAEDAEILKDKFDIYTSAQNMVQIFGLNNEVKPFDDVNVRKAINYAVNKKEIIDGAFGGYATELYSNFSPVMQTYYNSDLQNVYTQDIQKAKELLVQAGYPDGFDMTITVPNNYKQHVDTATILVEQLKQIGIKADVKLVEWATWLDKVNNKADYQSTVIGLSGKEDPNDVLIRSASSYKKNFLKFKNDRYDELINLASKELDNSKRAEYYKECQKIISEQAASVYICDPNLTVASKKDLKGYTFYPITFMDFSKLYYAE